MMLKKGLVTSLFVSAGASSPETSGNGRAVVHQGCAEYWISLVLWSLLNAGPD